MIHWSFPDIRVQMLHVYISYMLWKISHEINCAYDTFLLKVQSLGISLKLSSICVYINGVRLCLWIGSSPKLYMSMESHSGMMLTGETKELRKESATLPLCPPQIPHGLSWMQTWVSEVRGQWLAASAMARPTEHLCSFVQ
jgi:hypothetical protein